MSDATFTARFVTVPKQSRGGRSPYPSSWCVCWADTGEVLAITGDGADELSESNARAVAACMNRISARNHGAARRHD